MEGSFFGSCLFLPYSLHLIGGLKVGRSESLLLGEIYVVLLPVGFIIFFFFLSPFTGTLKSRRGRVGEQEKIEPYPVFLTLHIDFEKLLRRELHYYYS